MSRQTITRQQRALKPATDITLIVLGLTLAFVRKERDERSLNSNN
jgi:hypothetical protein